MFNRDCVRFPHAFAKAAAHRRVSAATTEQHTYQITLILASDDTDLTPKTTPDPELEFI